MRRSVCQWTVFLLGVAATLLLFGTAARLAYRERVPVWRRVEVDWTYPATKVAYLSDQLRVARNVILGDSVALRGLDAGCLSHQVGSTVNLAFSNADPATYYATAAAIGWAGRDTTRMNVLVVVYQDMFSHWREESVQARTRYPTTIAGARLLLGSSPFSFLQVVERVRLHLLDATWYRLFPRPIQVEALRDQLAGRLETVESDPTLFLTEPAGVCPCDEEIVPYRIRSWWVESHRCQSGTEPSFPAHDPEPGYRFLQRNDPSGIPTEYPYAVLDEILRFLQRRFADVVLIVFPDRYGYGDLPGFERAMVDLSSASKTHLVLLTDVEVSALFYDEHHALPEGISVLTHLLFDRLSALGSSQ